MALNNESLDQIFLTARTFHAWLDKPVAQSNLQKIYDLMKYGPTSFNCSPGRVIFVQSQEAKAQLIACLDKGNIEQTKSAPVTAIVAYDLNFIEKLPKLVPHMDATNFFIGNQPLIESTAFRNGTLQGAYLIAAARAIGLDCGPMSGFDNAKVDSTFLNGTSWRSNFLCNIGFGNKASLTPRAPRLSFEEACQIR